MKLLRQERQQNRPSSGCAYSSDVKLEFTSSINRWRSYAFCVPLQGLRFLFPAFLSVMMGRTSLSFCCPLYLLALCFIPKTEMFGGPPKFSQLVSTEQKALPMSGGIGPWTRDSEFNKPPPGMRPYHVFPMFDHVPAPLVDMELFRPVPGRRHMPSILSSLLIPQVNPQRIQVSPVRNTHGVEVWCGYSKVSVRVNRKLLGFRDSPASFYLGTCSASRSDDGFVYFHYDLNQCDSSLTVRSWVTKINTFIHTYICDPFNEI